MAVTTAQFTELCEILAKLDLFGSDLKIRPKLATAAAIKTAVQTGAAQIPLAYRDTYAAAVLKELDNILLQAQEMSAAERTMVIEQFYAPVYEHGKLAGMNDVRTELRRFLAVVSNLYRSFVNAKKRASLQVPEVKAPAPLAFFQSNGDQGPYTITSESMQKLFGVPIAVVSLPATYRSHGLLWCSLAHEVCGHDVVHADAQLVPELVEGVRKLFCGSSFDPNGKMTPDLLSALLWSYWIDEAVADVYGVLNMGPTFALNLTAFFSAMMARALESSSRTIPGLPYLRTEASARDPMGGDLHMDEHPVDLLRLYLAGGVVESLQGLDSKVRAGYLADIKTIAEASAHGATEIRVQGQVKISHANWRMIDETIPLAAAQEAARKVGIYLATAKLNALGKHSVQDIETWDDVDEKAAQDTAARVAANQSIVGAGDDAQLLAGCNIAVMAQPSLYAQMTELLHAGLDESYDRDPVWGSMKPNVMIVPSALYERKEPAPAPLIRKKAAKKPGKVAAKKSGKTAAKKSGKAAAKKSGKTSAKKTAGKAATKGSARGKAGRRS